MIGAPLLYGNNYTYAQTPEKRPNILLIVADDFGWGDLKPYGGDILAPNLDRLANHSLQFTNFHVMPVCSPTRSVLLTGVDAHKNGMGTMDVTLTSYQKGQPGYETYLNNKVTTVAQILKDNGYHTYLSGKWHLGSNQSNWPYNRGFEESFSLLHGAGTMWNGSFPIDAYKVQWVRNDKLVDWPNGNYSSDQYANDMIDMISKNHADGKPFFGYLAFQSTHMPLQAPAKYIKENEGRYDAGWDKIREQRLENQKKLVIIPNTTELSLRVGNVKAWDELPANVKANESKKMAVFAADAQAMDYNIGRVLDYLKKIGEYDNTLILFTADNGANPSRVEDLHLRRDIAIQAKAVMESYNTTEPNLGNWNSFVTYGPGWAQVSNTPFKGFKGQLSEGGIRVPLVMKTPGNSTHEIVRALAFGYDLVPTFLDYANATYPKTFKGINLEQLAGKSLLPIIEKKTEKVRPENETIPLEYFGVQTVYKGNLKAINLPRELGGDNQWHLYDLSIDPQESKDLAKAQPAVLQGLIAAYSQFANQTHVIPPNFAELGLGISDTTSFEG